MKLSKAKCICFFEGKMVLGHESRCRNWIRSITDSKDVDHAVALDGG